MMRVELDKAEVGVILYCLRNQVKIDQRKIRQAANKPIDHSAKKERRRLAEQITLKLKSVRSDGEE